MTRTHTVPVHLRGRGLRPRGSGRARRALIIASFLGPALVVLGAFVVYPIVYTVVRSLFDKGGTSFVGWQNYVTMFTNDTTFTAIRNNVIWVIVAPLAVTVLGLIFAVLVDRIGWKVAFRLIVFMPMAISMLAAGVIFRGMFQESPQLGVVNAAIVGVQSAFGEQSSYPGAKPRGDAGIEADDGIIVSSDAVIPGSVQNFPLTGIKQGDLPDGLVDGLPAATASDDEITGTVFLDVIRGGGGTNGELEAGKKGLEGVRVDAVDPDGAIRGYATTGAGGAFTIMGLEPGEHYRVALPAANFDGGAQGVSWLSATFINVVVILAYIWIWAGFAMVMIASGLSSIDRSLQEAARTDGANEWQVFRRITAPLLAPVLIVVLVTLIINVLKIFDLVYVIPPGASKPAANVIAVEMWTVSFGGGSNQGLGSALAILLLVLVLPSMIMNVRRFREERSR
ncbi:ABC transporter permease subunit [Leucobacter sp. gxy201]|uniref:carbohydrate ABC transporter permease n=1 Tax=Leucobacter sp. gxy201 TaxID=2957200 RepID=UPI003DA17987